MRPLDFLACAAFHPGHPVFWVLGALVGIAWLTLGLVALPRGNRSVRVGWAVGALLVVGEIAVSVWVYSRIDFNPAPAAAEVTGVWSDGAVRLQLDPDHTFAAGSERGSWALAGAGLRLIPAPAGFRQPHFISYSGRLRLLNMGGDPDDWHGELGLRRSAASARGAEQP